MLEAAEQLEFEKAAALRDRIMQLREQMGKKVSEVEVESYQPRSRRRGKGGQKVPRPKKTK